MAFTELELERIDQTVGGLCRRLSRPEQAADVRFVCDIDGHAVRIWEERPARRGGPDEWTRLGVARFRYYRSRGEWFLYWMRDDGKWHDYEPVIPTRSLARLVNVVARDRYCAFFG